MRSLQHMCNKARATPQKKQCKLSNQVDITTRDKPCKPLAPATKSCDCGANQHFVPPVCLQRACGVRVAGSIHAQPSLLRRSNQANAIVAKCQAVESLLGKHTVGGWLSSSLILIELEVEENTPLHRCNIPTNICLSKNTDLSMDSTYASLSQHIGIMRLATWARPMSKSRRLGKA